jgi:uncharacterized protein (DUF1778 family)
MPQDLDAQVWTRISQEQRQQLEKAAKEAHMSLSAFVRYCIERVLDELTPPKK